MDNLQHQGAEWLWRLIVGGFILGASLETFWPRRPLLLRATRRWFTNIACFALIVAWSGLFPTFGALGTAFANVGWGWGLFPSIGLPWWAQILPGVLMLDLGRYWLHRMEHANAILWRLHEMHHSDRDLDVTTAFRFHPLSIIPVQMVDLVVVLGLGLDPLAVLVFSAIVGVTDYVSHLNVEIPAEAERMLRLVLITPGIHRNHHAIDEGLHGTNFGVIFSFWDRMFHTFQDGANPEEFGVREVGDEESASLPAMLLRPFRSPRRAPDYFAAVSTGVNSKSE